MNGDGRLDIISGCYSVRARPMVGPVYVLYRTEKGDFEEAVALKTAEDKHLAMRGDHKKVAMTERICTEPHATDWDGDGDLDLLIGNFQGTFLVTLNVGTAKEPKFAGEPTLLKGADGKTLKINGNHSAPYLHDWDGDGDVDLLSGSGSGGVQIALNTPGEDGAHSFGAFEALIEKPKNRYKPVHARDEPCLPSTGTRIWVTDFNGDGKADLLVGDQVRKNVPIEGLSVEEASVKQAAWQKVSRELNDKYVAARNELDAGRRRAAAAAKDAASAPDEESDGGGAEEESEEASEGDVTPEPEHPTMEELQANLNKVQVERSGHYAKQRAFLKTIAEGHVWVYVRK